MMTADRTHTLAMELGIPRIAFVGNRALHEADVDRMEAFAAELGRELLIAIPEDAAVPAADRASSCVLDTAPDSEAVKAIGRLADRLEERFVPTG
jgi:CO dehydrogenase nickel-insertion accessory protein CooC1